MKYTRGDTVVGFEKLWFLQRRHAARYASIDADRESNANLTTPSPSHSLIELAVKPIIALLDQPSTSSDYSFYHTMIHKHIREYFVTAVVNADAQNYTNPSEFIQRNIYFFDRPSTEALSVTIPSLELHKLPSSYSNTVSPDTIIGLAGLLLSIPDEAWCLNALKGVLYREAISRGLKMTLGESVEQSLDEAEVLKVEKSWTKLMHQYLRWALVASKPGPDGVETMRILGREETGRRLATAEEALKGLKNESID